MESLKIKNDEKLHSLVELPMVPPLNFKLEKALKKQGINVFYTRRGNLSELLGSSKDKIPKEEKSGIYEIACTECRDVYIGQTSRRLRDRYAEHERALRLKNPANSAIAEHCITHRHGMGEAKLLKATQGRGNLNAWESFYIINGENLVNIDEPPIISNLFTISKNLTSK